MKKLIVILLVLSGVTFAQKVDHNLMNFCKAKWGSEYNINLEYDFQIKSAMEFLNIYYEVVEDQNVYPWQNDGFAGYKSHLLKKLEEQLSAIIAGGGERPGDKKE